MPVIRTPMPRVTRPEDLAGKTVAAVVQRYTHALGLRFTDGTWFYAKAVTDGFGDGGAELDCTADFEDAGEAHDLGVIDDAELARLEAERVKWQEAVDRAAYDRLKAMFGEGAGS